MAKLNDLKDLAKKIWQDALKKALGGVAVAAFVSSAALAQTPSLPGPPYNTDMGATTSTKFLQTAQPVGTINQAQQINYANAGVACTYVMTGESGSPSTTFGIQFFDSASNTYQTLVQNGTAVTALNTPTTVVVTTGFGPVTGTGVAALPTNWTVLGMHLPRFWRVFSTVANANTTATGTIGCNLFR
jgi:hypothetical protein